MKIRRRRPCRSGNVLVFAAFIMVGMFGMIALAVDLGYLHVVRTQLQGSADASALAATWELIDESALAGNSYPGLLQGYAESVAQQYATLNPVAGAPPTLDYQDVVVGRLVNPFDPSAQIAFDDPSRFNAVQVTVRRTAQQNGEVDLFFARVLGIASAAQQAQATAVFLNNVSGFRMPPSGEKLCILPFAMDEATWNALTLGTGSDDFGWNEELGQVTTGGDGIVEANLYPEEGLTSGNRGTVDIGSDNNSTADIARQITDGLSTADLEHHGGALQLGPDGTLVLNGDTGISAGVKDELASVIGDKGIIPIFREVTGPGNNAMYTIVKFVGVRVMEVELTGNISNKRVMIQPAIVTVPGGIVNTSDQQTSSFVYSPVWLIR